MNVFAKKANAIIDTILGKYRKHLPIAALFIVGALMLYKAFGNAPTKPSKVPSKGKKKNGAVKVNNNVPDNSLSKFHDKEITMSKQNYYPFLAEKNKPLKEGAENPQPVLADKSSAPKPKPDEGSLDYKQPISTDEFSIDYQGDSGYYGYSVLKRGDWLSKVFPPGEVAYPFAE
jgi:hypothetical protein